MTETLPLDGRSLTLEQFLAVVRGGCAVSLTPEARQAVAQSRRAVERAVAAGRPVYGVTTGFGAMSNHAVPPARARELQTSLIRSHASGAGPALPRDIVRGLILLRVNSLVRGHSGVRGELVALLVELLNRGLVPYIPEQGSVGASGDLAPLAHLGLAMMGEGEFIDRAGSRVAASAMLQAEGIAPLSFVEKE
ncbi:histidine ammonia-lyase, partial [mine drainage metagenome]